MSNTKLIEEKNVYMSVCVCIYMCVCIYIPCQVARQYNQSTDSIWILIKIVTKHNMVLTPAWAPSYNNYFTDLWPGLDLFFLFFIFFDF